MTQIITGNTRFIAHLGLPTKNFKAPMIYNPFFEDRGIDVVVVPMACGPDVFPQFLPLVLAQENCAGALVTMPHKISVLDVLDDVSTAVEICGSCNAVRRDPDGRLVGDMFDGEGFVRAVLDHGRKVQGATALMVGTGGVGSSIAASLAGAGLARIGLVDSDTGRARALAERIRRHYPAIEVDIGSGDPAGWDIVVNATPLGMDDGDPSPVDVSGISPESLVCEVVMKPGGTAFINAARDRGCAVQVGTDMLFAQVPAYLEFFGLPVADAQELRRLARIPEPDVIRPE